MEIILYLTVFVLAIFIGFEVISKIPPILHTPLMSGSNAISGISLIGAIIIAQLDNPILLKVLTFISILFATINIVGGFLVTNRMLKMFRKKD